MHLQKHINLIFPENLQIFTFGDYNFLANIHVYDLSGEQQIKVYTKLLVLHYRFLADGENTMPMVFLLSQAFH